MVRAVNAIKTREQIYQLISDVNMNNQPVTVTNAKGKNAVLIGEDDWSAIQETLYLNSIPGMVESIIDAGSTPLEECLSEDCDSVKGL